MKAIELDITSAAPLRLHEQIKSFRPIRGLLGDLDNLGFTLVFAGSMQALNDDACSQDGICKKQKKRPNTVLARSFRAKRRINLKG